MLSLELHNLITKISSQSEKDHDVVYCKLALLPLGSSHSFYANSSYTSVEVKRLSLSSFEVKVVRTTYVDIDYNESVRTDEVISFEILDAKDFKSC